MFYNQDILSRRKGGLGTVWLAATIGGKNLNRKLSRRDLLSVNIVEACLNVSSPTEPMALRLSSQLLYGVVRIHMQQAELWMNDVTHVHTSIKKIISDISASMGGTADIDLKSGGGQTAAGITLQSKAGGAFYGDFDYDFTWELAGAAGEDESSHGIASGALATASASSPRHTAAQRSITLAQPPTYDDEDLGVGREGGEQAFENMYLDDDGQPGLDLNLDEVDRPQGMDELFQDFGVPLAGAGRSSSQLGNDQFDFQDDGFQFPDDPVDPMQQFDADGLPIEPAFDMDLDEAVPGDAAAAEQAARSPSKRSSASADLIMTINKPNKKKRVAFSNVDPRTELSDAEMRESRRNYVTEMARQRQQIELKGAEKKSSDTARQLLFGAPLDLSEAPVLIEFWNSSVGARLKELDNVFSEKRARALRGSITPVPGREARDGSPGVDLGLDFDQEIAAGLLGDDGVDFGADDMPQLDDYPLDDNAFGQNAGGGGDLSSERGRAASNAGDETRLSQRQLPWNVQAAQRAAADETRTSGEVDRSRSRSRSFSVVDPILGPRKSDVSSHAPAESVRGADSTSGMMMDGGDQIPGFEDEEVKDPNASQLPSESQIRTNELEQEAQNFLEYAKTISSELPPGQAFMFTDLAPEIDTTPSVAALAFYHVLALTSSRKMKVQQLEPYGYINLTV